MPEPVALSGPQRIIRRVVAERRAGAPDHMIAEYAITEALHLLTGHDGAAADCNRCHNATARAVHDVRDPGGTTGASIVVDTEPPHRLTVRLIPHRDLAGVDQGPQPYRELQHTEACDRLKYGQRCPFDDRDDMDGWPAEPGDYEGWYWAGRNWTDAGWEYDAGIEWQRTDVAECGTAEPGIDLQPMPCHSPQGTWASNHDCDPCATCGRCRICDAVARGPDERTPTGGTIDQ